MNRRADSAAPARVLNYEPIAEQVEPIGVLLKTLLALSIPVLIEQFVSIGVGLTDTYVANHLASGAGKESELINAASGAAVGNITYLLWFVNLMTSAVGTGATAIIARATGARHQRLANSICGQAMGLAILAGAALTIACLFGDNLIARWLGLQGEAARLAADYVRLLAWCMPLTTIMYVGGSCLRGAGDTRSPAIASVLVATLNMLLTYGLTFGAFGLPKFGFDGIALGTVIAYSVGGVWIAVVLLSGKGGLRLFAHRLWPHWHNMKRLLRIGLPSGLESSLQWIANIALVHMINRLDTKTFIPAAAHNITVRIEGLSYLTGFGFAIAASTLVGQSLGMGMPRRARRCANLAMLCGGGVMTVMGLVFIFFGHYLARGLTEDPEVQRQVTHCLFITGFCQSGFAAAMVFGGALRGAGDTLAVMLINGASLIGLRLAGALVVAYGFGGGLTAIWRVMATELFIRGVLMYARFRSGRWARVAV